ncbi:MAG: hypothetical protein K8J08_19500 [Thermoanaerobaculia bacterium]|nr:hypothetical protein [Thermoanaerobaculia bacterium]
MTARRSPLPSLVLILAAGLLSSPSLAQVPSDQPQADPTQTDRSQTDQSQESSEPAEQARSDQDLISDDAPEESEGAEAEGLLLPPSHPCRSVENPPSAWLDRVQLQVYEAVCGSAHWFDSFFGSTQSVDDRHKPYGRVSANLQYDSIRGLEPKLRMRARITLPSFEDKVQAIVGRDDQDELLRDESTEFQNVTPSLRDTEDEWLLGLGYRPFGGSKQQLDFTGGLNLRFPLDPFVAARYRRHFVPGRRSLVRFRQTLFWRNVKGLGVASRLDVDRAFGEDYLVRWTSNTTYAEETEGVEWRTSFTLYQNLREGEAVAYQANWFGESKAPVTIEEFGLQAIYRKQVLREWLFLQVSPGVVWRREERSDPRAAVPVIGIGLEMLFGNHEPSKHDD